MVKKTTGKAAVNKRLKNDDASKPIVKKKAVKKTYAKPKGPVANKKKVKKKVSSK
jgi:hypothetical protein